MCLSQSSYLKKSVEIFRMSDAKSALTPFCAHFKMSVAKDDDECIDMDSYLIHQLLEASCM